MKKFVIKESEKIYNFLLNFYPKKYKQEFGEEMKFVFSESLKDAYKEKGEQGVLTVWTRTAFDAGKSLFIQYLEPQEGGEFMNNYISKNILRVIIGTLAILMIPLIGMQVSTDWDWNLFDFIVMFILLAGSGTAFVLVSSQIKNTKTKALIGIGVLLFVLLAWAELAVGVFGTPFAGS